MWMFGSGPFWTREAFVGVCSIPQTINCYFKIFLPTLAHHLGYRAITVQKGRKMEAWTVHPVKG